jgi:hypothetical protein
MSRCPLPRVRRIRWGWWALGVLLLVACREDEPRRQEVVAGSAPSGAVAATALPAPRPVGSVGAPPREAIDPASRLMSPEEADAILPRESPARLRVLETGAEPRAPLAYAFAKGLKAPLGMGIEFRLSSRPAGREETRSALPRLDLDVDVTPRGTSPSGAFLIDVAVRDAKTTPANEAERKLAEGMTAQLDAVRGMSVRYEVTPDGTVRKVDTEAHASGGDPAAQAVGQIAQGFESMLAPLPGVPVGVGARWEVVRRATSTGTELLQWVTYTLTHRDGMALTLELELRQRATDGAIAAPGLRPGMKAQLTEFDSRGKGTLTLDLSRPAPTEGKLDVQTHMEIALSVGGATAARAAGTPDTVRVSNEIVMSFRGGR